MSINIEEIIEESENEIKKINKNIEEDNIKIESLNRVLERNEDRIKVCQLLLKFFDNIKKLIESNKIKIPDEIFKRIYEISNIYEYNKTNEECYKINTELEKLMIEKESIKYKEYIIKNLESINNKDSIKLLRVILERLVRGSCSEIEDYCVDCGRMRGEMTSESFHRKKCYNHNYDYDEYTKFYDFVKHPYGMHVDPSHLKDNYDSNEE